MSITNGIHPPVDLHEQVDQLANNNELLQERIGELELALDSVDWRRIDGLSNNEFSRQGLKDITRMARLMFIKNPLIMRGISVRKFYIWGSGMNVHANQDEINQVLQDFLDDLKNRVEFTSHAARMDKEVSLEVEANIFFVFFTSKTTGHVRVRSIPFDEVEEIICNPDDSKEPWYYKRTWTEQRTDMSSGISGTTTRVAYYPDYGYDPQNRPASIGGSKIEWDSPIYHIKVGGFAGWKFGLSEIYAAIDWAQAYKSFLENWASIVKAYSRFAFNLTVPGGKAGIQSAKTRLATNYGSGSIGDTNPPSVSGSTFIARDDVKLDPIRTSGATTSADDGRRMSHMAMMVAGLPETFYSDAKSGSLATAKSLDRPTELMMTDRQTFWADVHRNIFNFVLLQAIKYGPLKNMATIVVDEDGSDGTERIVWNEGVDDTIDINFPPLVSNDVAAQVGAVVAAATLGGSTLAGVIDARTVTTELLTLLGIPNADDVIAAIYNDDGTFINPPAPKVVAAPFGAAPTPPIAPAQPGTPPVVAPADAMPPAMPMMQNSAAETIMVNATKRLQETLDAILRDVI